MVTLKRATKIYYSNPLICIVPQIIVERCQGTLTLNIPFSAEELQQSIQVVGKLTAQQDSFENSWQQVHLATKWKE